jgi:hypothetical protein
MLLAGEIPRPNSGAHMQLLLILLVRKVISVLTVRDTKGL